MPNTHPPGEVDNPELVPFIVKDGANLPGIVVDEMDAKLVGNWQYSTHTPPYVGVGYLHDQKQGWVKISSEGTEGKYVIADAVQFIPCQ